MSQPLPESDAPARPTLTRYLVLFAFCLSATLAYVHRNCVAVVEKDIRADLGLTPEQSGWMMSAFLFTYAVFQIPTGAWAQSWGTRKALSLYAFVWSVMVGCLSLATGMTSLLLYRLGMGVGQAGVFPCSTNSVAKWFPTSQLAQANGAILSFMGLGAAAGAVITASLVQSLGWRWTFFVYAIPGVVWAAWFYWWFRDYPQDHPSVNAAELALIRGTLSSPSPDVVAETPSVDSISQQPVQVELPEPTPWGLILTSPTMGFICAQHFFRAAGVQFYQSWFTTYLREERNLNLTQAGFLTSLPLIGVAVGSLLGGRISDRLLVYTGSRRISRQLLSVICLLICSGLILVAYRIEDVRHAVYVLSLGSFIAACAGSSAYTITIDVGGKHIAPVFGMMNMFGNFGAMACPVLVPLLVKHGGWNSVFYTFSGVYVAAAISWMLLNPERTITAPAPVESQKENTRDATR